MFFVNWQSYIPKQQLKYFNSKIYIGLIDNKYPIIYFYLFNNKKYSFEFLLQFNDEEIMHEEIKNNIKREGVGQYISEAGVDISKVEESFNLPYLMNLLIIYDLKVSGIFNNFNNNYMNKI